MARRHKAHLMYPREFPFRIDGVACLELSSLNLLANGELDPLICRRSVSTVLSHFGCARRQYITLGDALDVIAVNQISAEMLMYYTAKSRVNPLCVEISRVDDYSHDARRCKPHPAAEHSRSGLHGWEFWKEPRIVL